ncbi:hypothetical protein D3C85_1694520 [compost metagenome]
MRTPFAGDCSVVAVLIQGKPGRCGVHVHAYRRHARYRDHFARAKAVRLHGDVVDQTVMLQLKDYAT